MVRLGIIGIKELDFITNPESNKHTVLTHHMDCGHQTLYIDCFVDQSCKVVESLCFHRQRYDDFHKDIDTRTSLMFLSRCIVMVAQTVLSHCNSLSNCIIPTVIVCHNA